MNLVNHSFSRSGRPTDWRLTDELLKGRYPRVWIVITSPNRGTQSHGSHGRCPLLISPAESAVLSAPQTVKAQAVRQICFACEGMGVLPYGAPLRYRNNAQVRTSSLVAKPAP